MKRSIHSRQTEYLCKKYGINVANPDSLTSQELEKLRDCATMEFLYNKEKAGKLIKKELKSLRVKEKVGFWKSLFSRR